jgi:hypothetical protein
VDDALASGIDPGPLAGIPFAIKVFAHNRIFIFSVLTVGIASFRRTTFACPVDPLLLVRDQQQHKHVRCQYSLNSLNSCS